MLGAIASFVGYGLGGELASKGIQKLGRYSLSAGFKALNSLKSSGAGVRAIITHAAKTRAASGFRQVFNSTKKLAFDELQAKSHHVQDNFTKRLVSGYNRRINVVARKFGGKKAFTRRIVRDAIRGEAKFLPINYAMYKHEQHTGAIDPESGFGKYYLTQGLPMGIAFSAGLDAGKRALKVAGHRSFKGNRAAVFGMEAIVKLGAESLHKLNATTKGMFAVYDNSVSKLMAANATFGAFRGTSAAIREITHVANTTSTRRARRDDFFRYKANKADYDSHLDEKLTNSYRETMGDARHDMDSSRRRLMPIDTFSLENTELKRAGWNKKINSYHGKLRELAGMRSTGDEIGYTTSKRRTSVDIYSEKDGQINLRREDKYLTQDRGKMDILGSQYDFGNFHIDAIRDSLNKIATQTLNIANRPWLNFLDGGNNWLMSKKTKMLQFGLKRGQGVVGAGFKSTTRVSIAASPDPEVSKLIGEGQFEEAAHLGIKNIFGATDEQATMYLNSKRNKAIEALSRQPNSSATTADLHEKVTEDIAKRMRFGEVEFGTGDVLDIIGGKAQLHTNIGGFGYTTFSLRHSGVELTGTSLLRGDTRAGQLAGSVLGGRHNVDSIYGNEISVGVESSETIKHTDYYKTDHWFAKIAGALELGGGQEQSLLGKMRTMYTKWSDPSYIGMHVSNIKRGILDRNSLDQAMSKNTLNAHSTIEMAKAYGNYADHGVREVYSYVKAASMANASHTPEMDFPAIYSRIKTAIQDAPGLDPKYGQFLNDFDPLKMVIGTNDSSSVIKNKIQHLRKLREKHEGISDILGLDVTAADELQEILSTSGTGNVHSALGRIKNRISPIDKVNRNIFETLISVAHAGDRVDPSVGHVLSVVATEGRALAQRGGLNENQVSPSGILNMLHLRKNANHFMSGKETKIEERQLNYFKSDILEMNDHYGEFGLVESMASHGGKKRLREAASAENHFILLSENNWSTKGLDTAGFRTLPIGRGEVEQLAAVNTMNSALALMGLGFNIGNKTVTIGDIVQKTMLKRVVPFIGLMAANDFAMGVAQNTPGLQDTSLAGGITGAAWDAYAGARVLGQTVSDFTGMTSVAKYVEGLMPGTIDSPLSGLVRGMLPIAMGLKLGSGSRLGATRGGLIGTGIGMLLGGGPLGLFGDWNIAKGREEVIQELSGEKETEVRKGRFWEMSGGSFFGNKTTYFRPHQYALQKMQYQRGSNYIGNDPVDELTSYIDPSVYARKHYLSRPYPEVGDIGSNMPIIGSLVGAISGPEMMHQEDMQTMADSALLSGRSGGLPSPTPNSNGMASGIQPTSPFAMDEAGFYGGNVIGANTRNMMAPTSSGSFESVVDTTADNMLDVAGLRGFVLGSVMEGVAGSSTGFGGGMRLESGNNIASMSKLYWEKEYGGIVGLSEGIRRILPNPSTGGTEYWNELPNTQANFLPGQGSFTDFLVGDAESKVQYGEVRLPGGSYELTKNIFYTYPIDASMMRRPYEEQVGFYAGDVLTLSTMRKRWHVVERTRKELVAGLKSSMEIVKERDVAYDPDNDVHAYVDAISKDPTGEKTAILVAPIDRGSLDPAGEAQLNAFLVTNTKEIHNGLLIGLDKDGNTTKQIIHADAKRYMQDLKASRQAAQSGASMTKELEDSGESVNRWPAYSHLNRLEILLNVAPFSPEAQLEMKIIKQQKETGQFGAKQKDKYYQLMDNFVKRLNSLDTDEYRFLPLLMGKTPLGTAAAKRMIETDTNYSKPEQYVGGVWEYLSHLRNPISNKLLGNRSIMEAYKQDMAIGKGFKQWTDPVSDFVLNPLEVVASEEDPVQATISGATGGFIFGGPIGAGVGALSAGLSAAMGVTTSERSSRWEQLDRVHAMADALKYKEIEQMDESEMGSERRFTLRRKSSIYYNYTQGTQEGPVGANDVVGSVNPAERSYVRRIMQNLYKEDVEGLGNLMPEYSKGLLDSYATGQAVDTSKYSSYMSQSRRVIDGAPLKFRSDDMIYKTLQNQGYQATDLSLGWKQQINRVRYIESQGNDIPDLTQDPGYPGIVPRFSTLR